MYTQRCYTCRLHVHTRYCTCRLHVHTRTCRMLLVTDCWLIVWLTLLLIWDAACTASFTAWIVTDTCLSVRLSVCLWHWDMSRDVHNHKPLLYQSPSLVVRGYIIYQSKLSLTELVRCWSVTFVCVECVFFLLGRIVREHWTKLINGLRYT